jgi:hypothetical protein
MNAVLVSVNAEQCVRVQFGTRLKFACRGPCVVLWAEAEMDGLRVTPIAD